MAEIGYGYPRQETINIASDFAHHLGLCDKSHHLRHQWLYIFLRRWPELKVKKPRSLVIARARSATRPAIDSYFTEIGKIIDNIALRINQIIFLTLMKRDFELNISLQRLSLVPSIKLKP